MSSDSIFDKRITSALVLISLIALVVGMWLWIPPYLAAGLKDLSPSDLKDLSQIGLYGDSFGAINSLFTGLAFAALIFTILLQQREIKLQRYDLRSQIGEMELSRAQIKRQADLQEKQIGLDVASLKMKKLEVRIIEIQMIAEKWVPSVRFKEVATMFDEVKQQMEEIMDVVESGT